MPRETSAKDAAARGVYLSRSTMKKILLPFLLAALAAFTLPLLRAQEPTAAPAKAPPTPLISLDFPGGTLAQFVALAAKTPGGPVNVIGEPADLATQLPAFSLQNVHPDLVARALNNFLFGRGLTLVPSGLNVPGSRDLYTVQRTDKRPRPMMPPPDAFESMQLGPFLEQYKIDDIVGAIRAAWELDPTHDAGAMRLKFHPPTSILLVSGPPEAIMVASKTVGTLKRRDEHLYAPAPKSESPPKSEKR
jgi:hypothetical protein